jgi:hypothetical protein
MEGWGEEEIFLLGWIKLGLLAAMCPHGGEGLCVDGEPEKPARGSRDMRWKSVVGWMDGKV